MGISVSQRPLYSFGALERGPFLLQPQIPEVRVRNIRGLSGNSINPSMT